MTTAVQLVPSVTGPLPNRPIHILPVPWRDPHTVSPVELKGYIATLERACAEHPGSVDLRTILGMAHAMNLDVHRSMDVLEEAVALDGNHFYAQMKYAELWYRIRGLIRAERETLKALELAGNGWELAMARKQLQTIRELMRLGTQKPEWDKSLKAPALAFVALVGVLSAVAVIWK